MSEPAADPQRVDESAADERDDAVIGSALRWSFLVFGIIGGIAAGVGAFLLAPGPAPAPRVSELAPVATRTQTRQEVPAIPLVDVTGESGITFVHENGDAGEKLLPETMGGGVALIDYDSDGDFDLLFINSSRWPWDTRPPAAQPPTHSLYRNDGDWKFVNVTAEAGLAEICFGQGVAVGDYDNDGDSDIFISAVGLNSLYRNDGGRFVNVSAEAGVAGVPEQWSTSCGWLDYDRDGDLDLFVANYVGWTREFDLAQPFQLLGVGRAYGRPQNFPGSFPYLYRNDGGRFTEVGEAAGLHVKNPATGVPAGKSLGTTFIDLDEDGWLEIVVANDTVQNFLFHNQQDGTFREVGTVTGIAFDNDGAARGAMGIDAAHFRNNREVGIVIGNFSNEPSALYVERKPDLQFTDEAISTGLGPQSRLELTFGMLFVDLDLDGRLDIVSANGHLEKDINKVQASQHYAQRPHLFWNCGPLEPTEFMPIPVERTGPAAREPMVGRGATTGDLDGDGDLDLVLVSCGGQPRLLRNDQSLSHHWVRFQLKGKTAARDGIGSLVQLQLSPTDQRSAAIMPTRSYLSQSEPVATFGLGTIAEIPTVTIRWSDGTTQTLKDVAIDRLHVIEQLPDAK